MLVECSIRKGVPSVPGEIQLLFLLYIYFVSIVFHKKRSGRSLGTLPHFITSDILYVYSDNKCKEFIRYSFRIDSIKEADPI
jgi:hypothetical protein